MKFDVALDYYASKYDIGTIYSKSFFSYSVIRDYIDNDYIELERTKCFFEIVKILHIHNIINQYKNTEVIFNQAYHDFYENYSYEDFMFVINILRKYKIKNSRITANNLEGFLNLNHFNSIDFTEVKILEINSSIGNIHIIKSKHPGIYIKSDIDNSIQCKASQKDSKLKFDFKKKNHISVDNEITIYVPVDKCFDKVLIKTKDNKISGTFDSINADIYTNTANIELNLVCDNLSIYSNCTNISIDGDIKNLVCNVIKSTEIKRINSIFRYKDQFSKNKRITYFFCR